MRDRSAFGKKLAEFSIGSSGSPNTPSLRIGALAVSEGRTEGRCTSSPGTGSCHGEGDRKPRRQSMSPVTRSRCTAATDSSVSSVRTVVRIRSNRSGGTARSAKSTRVPMRCSCGVSLASRSDATSPADRRGQPMLLPPLTQIVCPVMNRLSSPARKDSCRDLRRDAWASDRHDRGLPRRRGAAGVPSALFP